MQTYPNLFRVSRYITILLIHIFLLLSILPATLIYADDGDFVWANAMGGTSSNYGRAISSDASGNIYTTGDFFGTVDFDPGPGVFNLISAGRDIFICKLDSNGNFIWAKALGGTSSDRGRGISVDTFGNVYTTGLFSGTGDFDPGSGTFHLTSTGDSDIFISKLDSNGNFIWAKAMGGISSDNGYGISTDSSGNVYTTGSFSGTGDFDPGPEIFNLNGIGSSDIFISKLSSNGDFVWAKALVGDSNSLGRSISIDYMDNIYISGGFAATVDFDPGSGTFNLTSTGNHDIFISKLDSNGDFVWAKAMGGTSNDDALSVTVDIFGNVYSTGWFDDTVDFDPGPETFNLTAAYFDIFISKLDSNGNFIWAKAMGGTLYDDGDGIIIDTCGNVYTTGMFSGTSDFDPGPGTFNLTSIGGSDIFISKLDSNGDFVWAKAMGGTSSDAGAGIIADTLGNVYTTGNFFNTVDFDPGPETFNLTSIGGSDIFIVRLNAFSSCFPWPMFLPAIIGGQQ